MTVRRSLCFAGLLGWLLAVPAAAQVELAGAQGRRVTRVEVVNHSRVRDREIRHLSQLRPGAPYAVGVVQRGLRLLAQKPEIAEVVVRGELDGADGLVVTLEVEAAPLVYAVRFRGNRVLDDDELRSRLRTAVDRPLHPEDLNHDRAQIRKRYAEEGFPEAEVAVERDLGPDGHWLRLEFRVEEGSPLPVLQVAWPEDLPLEPGRAGRLLGLGPGDPASVPRLRQGVKRLVEALRGEGYPEANARRPRFEDRDGGVEVVLGLHAGPATDLRFAGIEYWESRTLRPLLRARYGEPITAEWLGEVSRAMREQLQAEGYYGARVGAVETRASGRRQVTFQVERGPRTALDEVEFEGNESLSSRTLRSYMSLVVGGLVSRPPFGTAALDRDLKALTGYYASQGFLDARVAVLEQEVPPSGKVRLLIRVDEGPRYRYGSLQCVGDLELPAPELGALTGLYPGMLVDPPALERGRRALLRYLERRGRERARVEMTSERDTSGSTVRVRFRVVAGPPETFGQIVVSGNARTQTKVIRRELTFSEGELWNPEAVAESRRRIYRLGFFRSVRIEPLPAAVGGGVRDVRIRVEEQDVGSFTFGVGYGSEEGPKGSVSLAHTNLQGYGRALELRASADDLDESYAVNLREPWLFNHPVDLRLSLLKTLEKRDAYDLSTLGFQSALQREVSAYLRGSLLYTLSRNRLSSVRDPEVVSDEDLNDYLLSAIGPVLAWDSRDDPFNPRRGVYSTLTGEWALPALGSQVRYDRYTAGGAAYLSAGRHTLALYAGGGIALKLASGVQLPVNKRFFLGGRNTVRGYQRDEIGPTAEDGTAVGGDTMVNAKAEWRYPVWRKLGGVLFWDAGNVWNRQQGDRDYTHLRQGVGGGLRYLTPVGPLSLDLGWKLDRRSGEAPSAWHFTVGNVF
jgi:outer membrane protein insertion porin family